MKSMDVRQPVDQRDRAFAKVDYAIVGLRNYANNAKKIPVTVVEEIPAETWHEDCEWNGDCEFQEVPELCGPCLAHHYDGLMQAKEDNYRDR